MNDKYLWNLVYTIFTILMEGSLYRTIDNENQLSSIKALLFLLYLSLMKLAKSLLIVLKLIKHQILEYYNQYNSLL